jgi:phosphodiester glycosidase
MKFSELADALIRWGAHDAVSLDGGGSTTFVMDDPATPANDPRVMNLPCDLLPNKERGKERTVANNLAVFARRKAGSAKPQAAGIRKGVRAKAGS